MKPRPTLGTSSAVEAEILWGKMSEFFAHWPDDYHAPEHPPEDQSWGWLIVLAVAALATLAGVVICWPAAIAVIVVAAALVLVPSLVRRRHLRPSSAQAVENSGDE